MDAATMTLGSSILGDLLPALERLDRRIAQAISAAETMESAPVRDPFRGLHIGPDDVTRWLARMPGAPLVTAPTGENPDASMPTLAADSRRLHWLAQTFGLSAFELDIVVIALAPEIGSSLRGCVRLSAGRCHPPPAERRPGTEPLVSLRRDQIRTARALRPGGATVLASAGAAGSQPEPTQCALARPNNPTGPANRRRVARARWTRPPSFSLLPTCSAGRHHRGSTARR